MCVSREGFREEMSKVVSGLDFLDFKLPTGDQLLSEAKNLRINMLDTVALDEAGSYMSYACGVVFEEDGWLGCHTQAALLYDDPV